MDWLNDSLACLEEAELQLETIRTLINTSMSSTQNEPKIKLTSKNFIENCRSPLDYVACYAFDKYCKSNYEEKELKRMKTYFPILSCETRFEECIAKNFKGLKEIAPEVFDLFQSLQPFNGNQWILNLNSLAKENKHRNLTKQRVSKNTHIKRGQIGGVTMENVTIENCETPIVYNGTPIDFITPSPYDSFFDAKTELVYFFKNGNLQVLPTLTDIYNSSKKSILLFESLLR